MSQRGVYCMSERSDRIYNLMVEQNISYGELSKKTDIPKSALQRYATGQTAKIPIDRIEKIAIALNSRAEYIMGWEKKEQPSAVRKELSDREMALLELFDQMPEEKQDIAFKMIQAALGSK